MCSYINIKVLCETCNFMLQSPLTGERTRRSRGEVSGNQSTLFLCCHQIELQFVKFLMIKLV